MRVRIFTVAVAVSLGVIACLDFKTSDPCARFAGRELPASCLNAGGGGTGGGGGGTQIDSGTPDSGAPISCEPLVLQTGDAGDLLRSCTFTDGGPSDCELDEHCVHLGTLYICVKYCGADPTQCPFGTTCRSNDWTQGTLPGICVPNCDPNLPGAGCPSPSFKCAPSSPSLNDPGFCTPDCQVLLCAAGETCNASGLCECSNDNGCGFDTVDQVQLKCSPNRRCYRPCAAGCGDGCCDSTTQASFCRAAKGTAPLCSHCTKDSDCATGLCGSNGKCNYNADVCENTGECDRFSLQCSNYFCVCPQ
ncbi:MAG: hypothetical protein ACJ790_03805 [Myxococcaceae bacterium]